MYAFVNVYLWVTVTIKATNGRKEFTRLVISLRFVVACIDLSCKEPPASFLAIQEERNIRLVSRTLPCNGRIGRVLASFVGDRRFDR